MTVKEKARELAIKYTKSIDNKGTEVYNIGAEVACNEMALFVIKKVKDWLADNIDEYAPSSYGLTPRMDTVSINYDLSKAMEE